MNGPPPDGMLLSERLPPRSATRPAPPLPGGKRLAAWVIVNIEEWDELAPMPRRVNALPTGGEPSPDVPNWCWHEYGNRVGFWRLLEILDAAGCACGLAINGRAVETYPEISQAALDRGWEFMGHCWLQRSLQRAPDEREEIRLTTEAIARFTGKPPRGWLGAALAETWTTPERLVEAGYDYVCDWVVDDVPLRLRTRNGSIASVPYSQEVNDVPMILQQQHPAREWRDRAIDQFEQLRQDAREAPRVLALVVHPYIMGAPHRARYVREALAHINASGDVAWMTGGAILDHWGV